NKIISDAVGQMKCQPIQFINTIKGKFLHLSAKGHPRASPFILHGAAAPAFAHLAYFLKSKFLKTFTNSTFQGNLISTINQDARARMVEHRVGSKVSPCIPARAKLGFTGSVTNKNHLY
ncbi:MAG: hypothetical protein V3R67_00925, partial [Thermodesulfobacteriota bacterium]